MSRLQAFLEGWWTETELAARLGLLRNHTGAAAVLVAELSPDGEAMRLLSSSCREDPAAERVQALAAEMERSSCRQGEPCYLPPVSGRGGFPASCLYAHPPGTPGDRLSMALAFDEVALAEGIAEALPYLCAFVLESAKLSIQQAATLSTDRMLQQSQRLASIGRLASGVAHDFNNLLTVMQGNAAMLDEHLAAHPDERACEAVHQLIAAGNRAAALSRQLLRFSRGEAEEVERIDLNGLVSDFLGMASRMLEETIQIRVELTDGELEILGDRGMVGQMLMNLIVNARDAMQGEGAITIRTFSLPGKEEGSGPWACVEVADDGCGIPAEELSKIFDPFYTTKERGKGTGLGLPNTRALIEKLGGRIVVESEVGKGSCFQLRLPSASSAARAVPDPAAEREADETGAPREDADRARPAAPASSEGGEQSIRGATVLLVEDDASVRKLVRRLLEMNGCEVIEAISGREAIERWPEIRDSVSLVVTDVIMPGGVSGWDLAESLHQDRPGLGILLTSGYTEHDGNETLKACQQIEFLQKPYEASKLRDTLCRLRFPAA